MPARSIWSGSISFGLVNIPIKLYTAVREERVAFHLLHDQDHVRLQRKMVCPADNQEIHPEHMVRGYEIGPDQYVVVRDEELEALAPEKSRNVQITDFVDQSNIDPIFYNRPYYLLPGEHAAKPYFLLHEAMRRAKKVAISRFVMREHEYLAALRPLENLLCLVTMRFNHEIVPIENLELAKPMKVEEKELKMAQQLIDSLAGPFKPEKYHDEYRRKVTEMIERKAKGEEVVRQAPVERRTGKAVNLLEALEASLAEAKKKTGPANHGGEKRAAAHHRRKKS